MSTLIDLTGKKFDRLLVLRRGDDVIDPSGRKRVMWVCKCDCGKIVSVKGDSLKQGRTRSCGCYRSEIIKTERSTHHETNSKLYGVWCAMKSRCNNENSTYYERYGGRGIKVCDEWNQSYESFRDWANENGYRDGLSIDRIDNDMGYFPSNCRWVTCDVQASNRSSNRKLTHNGETHTVTEWGSILGINPKTIFTRIYTGKSVSDALAI